MPAVLSPSLVLVTGASGFSAAWVVEKLLKDGYRVRGTVRSEQKGQYIKSLFEQYGDKLETVIVPDVSVKGAFDSYLQDVEAVIHIAAAVALTTGHASAIQNANIEGVGYLLESMKIHGKSLKRFVYMSSAKALVGQELGYIYTESDWNEKAVAAFEEQGDKVEGENAYAASKVIAERAIMKFTETEKVPWDATRLVPAWIYGPIIHDCKSLDDLNLSTRVMYGYLTTPQDNPTTYCTDYIDVRDVAAAFVASLKVEAAGGKRFCLDAGSVTYQNLYDAVHSISPDLPAVPYGDANAAKFEFPGAFVDSSAAVNTLKLEKFIGIGQIARETLESLADKGLIKLEKRA